LLTHYWKLVASPGQDWKTFTHLNGSNIISSTPITRR